jgi:hypothetical protein
LTDLVSVVVLVPPGVETVVCAFSLLSSEHPGIPLQKPTTKTPMIDALINLRISVILEFGKRGGQRTRMRSGV